MDHQWPINSRTQGRQSKSICIQTTKYTAKLYLLPMVHDLYLYTESIFYQLLLEYKLGTLNASIKWIGMMYQPSRFQRNVEPKFGRVKNWWKFTGKPPASVHLVRFNQKSINRKDSCAQLPFGVRSCRYSFMHLATRLMLKKIHQLLYFINYWIILALHDFWQQTYGKASSDDSWHCWATTPCSRTR